MIHLLFYFSIFAFTIGNLARISLGNGVALTLFDISIFFLVTTWGIGKMLRKESLTGDLLRPITIFILVCVISLAANSFLLAPSELFIASLYLIRWIWYAGIYFVVKDMKITFKKRIPLLLIAAGIGHVLIGYGQYFFYPDLSGLYHLGWDEHLYRMFGSLLDPNYQGAIYVLVFMLLFIILQRTKLKKDTKKYAMYIVLLLTLLAIVLTYSRSSLLMFFACGITYALMTGRKKIIGILIAIIFAFVVLFSNIYIEGLNPLRTASSAARISSMQEALVIIQHHPVIGVGFNAYRYAQNRFGFRTSEFWMTSHADAGTDNSYLFILATTGLVGLLAYGNLLRKIFLMTVASEKTITTMQIVTRVSFVGILIHCLFINSLFYPFILYWLWTLVGLTENR